MRGIVRVKRSGSTEGHVASFLSATGDGLALLYNDTSVLENHHCTMAFKLMQKEGCNVLESFGRKKLHGVRRIIVDMASHLMTLTISLSISSLAKDVVFSLGLSVCLSKTQRY